MHRCPFPGIAPTLLQMGSGTQSWVNPLEAVIRIQPNSPSWKRKYITWITCVQLTEDSRGYSVSERKQNITFSFIRSILKMVRPKTDRVFPLCGNGILKKLSVNSSTDFIFEFPTSMFSPWNRCGIANCQLFPQYPWNISRLKSAWNIPQCGTFSWCFHFHWVCLRCGLIWA